jgi:hypothetical protein
MQSTNFNTAADPRCRRACFSSVSSFGIGYGDPGAIEPVDAAQTLIVAWQCSASASRRAVLPEDLQVTGVNNVIKADVVANTQIDAARSVTIEFDSNLAAICRGFRPLQSACGYTPAN